MKSRDPAKPTVAFLWHEGDAPGWKARMVEILGDFDMRTYSEICDPDDIDYAVVWMPPLGELRRYRNLKGVFSVAAGISHILRDPQFPRHVPIVRLSDEALNLDMVCHAIHWVLHFHRGYNQCLRSQQRRAWARPKYRANSQRSVGILGMGTIGVAIASQLRDLQFDVSGWSRTPKEISGVSSYHGHDRLEDFLQRTDILVSLLPPTPSTIGLIDRQKLSLMPIGSFIINIGRGEVFVDADLVELVDKEHIAGAALDVFSTEPLPPDSPYWGHPNFYVTPHIAGPTSIDYGARRIAENIRRMMLGQVPNTVADVSLGY